MGTMPSDLSPALITTTSLRISTTMPETMVPGFNLASGLALFKQFGKTLSHVGSV